MSAAEGQSGAAAPRWQDLARRAAERRSAEEDSVAVRRLLTFVLDGSPYAVPVERVREIVRVRPITPVPRVPSDVCGVISLRGEILEVIDLRLRLRLRAAPTGRASRIIVVYAAEGGVAGLLVDGVTEVAGQSASPNEVPNNGRFVFLRQGSHLHGAFGGHSQYVGLETEGIYRVWMQVMSDGTAAVASSGRARASGTAFGEVEIGLTSDPVGNPIPDGNCGLTTPGHQWSLEPA